MNERLPYREKVIACERGGTYKYFFAARRVRATWEALVRAYGPINRDSVRATMQIVSRAFIVRATLLGNPITVFRKRTCSDGDVAELHRILEFTGD